MNEFILYAFDNLFYGFCFSYIIVIVVNFFMKEENDFISKFIIISTSIIPYIGLGYIIYYTYSVSVFYLSEENSVFSKRAVGPYAWAYWYMLLRPFIFSLLSLLFWQKNYKKINIKGFLLVLTLLILVLFSGSNFERFVIIITSLHRDYLPSSWVENTLTIDILFTILILIIKNVAIYSSLVLVVWTMKNYIKPKIHL